ncbi:cytochrome aa3 quinol oxidase subunit IV [Bacillus sp. CGMCC 1.16541]|uniref:cytochrome aa3 quinol oxidase subunit IV n=1 Tax=Bacillus sp. CGMCC 1.16541 TaxID=2185143 RepID=UPI000D73029A|nr:cytochrome aa3 quinol oxidase subunit IV [Bacillus sp. CGMCC 1.16541]
MENNQKAGFPLSHVFGLILSLALTFAALGLVVLAPLSKGITMVLIMVLAILQAVMQLVMFMHMAEGENGKIQIANMLYSFFIAICIVVGSLWILADHFNH